MVPTVLFGKIQMLSNTYRISKLQKNENTPIPKSTSFKKIKGLSNEAKQKLEEARPTNLARASRLSGITPATVSLLLVHLKKTTKKSQRP